MSLEQILEQTAHARPGYDLVSFKEAGVPVYVLKLRILVLERKALSPIEEAVLKAVRAGLDSPGSIYEFLGLSRERSSCSGAISSSFLVKASKQTETTRSCGFTVAASTNARRPLAASVTLASASAAPRE